MLGSLAALPTDGCIASSSLCEGNRPRKGAGLPASAFAAGARITAASSLPVCPARIQ